MRKLWGGAFDGSSHELADAFGQSISSDLTFWLEDVEGSEAHAKMLHAQGILSKEDADQILWGLARIKEEGRDSLPNDAEDVHTAVEQRLRELIGEPAGRLHTARSRNDQVALDGRLWLSKALDQIAEELKGLQRALVERAEEFPEAVLPGVTHQQHAQPITLGFHLLAHFWMHQRHGARLENLQRFVKLSPLGSAALSGTGFPIDRDATAAELGFAGPIPNALDATSDRGWVMDGLHLCSLIMIDLSRLCQEIVLWSSPEFGFVRLPDALTTGSSIMPQKRNPDLAELIRGRTGRAIGNWTGLACTMKGLVLGYNRDTQEDKPPLFDSVELVCHSLKICTLMIQGAEFRVTRMLEACKGDFATATDLADLLAESGIPFRTAHEITGRVVRFCEERAIGLEDLTEELLLEAAPEAAQADMAKVLAGLQPIGSASRRDSFGGTSPRRTREQLARCLHLLADPGFRDIM